MTLGQPAAYSCRERPIPHVPHQFRRFGQGVASIRELSTSPAASATPSKPEI